ncbi:MAG: hypothetical protein RLZZ546_2648 [Bacteroidota bacterium]|jgi:hypothetical protein
MCQISNKIKFCTCEIKDTDKLDHYWELHRFNPDKDLGLLGETMLPHLDNDFEINSQTLIKVLNENVAFDQPITFQSKDVFVVILYSNDSEKRKSYSFIYKNKKWKSHDQSLSRNDKKCNYFYLGADCLTLPSLHDQLTQGRVESF